MIKIGFIDYYLDQYHAQNYPKWLCEVSGGEIQVTAAWAMTDRPGGITSVQCASEGGYALLESPQAVIDACDGLIVMSPDHAEMHEELCRLPLASGKPTYVDKTFATDRETALRIIENADRHGTPFYSTSALRYADEVRALERDGISFIAGCGPGEFNTYAIHQMEPIVYLMGHGIEKILFYGTEHAPAFALRFDDGRAAAFSQFGGGNFMFNIKYENGDQQTVNIQSDFYKRFLEDLAGFFRDGSVRVPIAETLKIITVLQYGHKAMQFPDTWIKLP